MSGGVYGGGTHFGNFDDEARDSGIELATKISAAIELLLAVLSGGEEHEVRGVMDRFAGAVPEPSTDYDFESTDRYRFESTDRYRSDRDPVGISIALLRTVALALAGVADQCGEKAPTSPRWRISVGGQDYLTCAHAPPHTRRA